jgi:hypothetical protein
LVLDGSDSSFISPIDGVSESLFLDSDQLGVFVDSLELGFLEVSVSSLELFVGEIEELGDSDLVGGFSGHGEFAEFHVVGLEGGEFSVEFGHGSVGFLVLDDEVVELLVDVIIVGTSQFAAAGGGNGEN